MLFLINFCLVLALLFSFCFLLLSLISPRISMFWSKKQYTKKDAAIFYLKVFAPTLVCMIIFVNFFGDTLQKDADKTKLEIAIKEHKADSLKHINDSLKHINDSLKVIEDIKSSIDIGDILDKYNDNRVAADQAFQKKELVIYGIINHIEKVDNDKAYITLRALNRRKGYDRILCYLKPKDVLNFNSNDMVYVKGRFDGVESGFNVLALKMDAKQVIPVKE